MLDSFTTQLLIGSGLINSALLTRRYTTLSAQAVALHAKNHVEADVGLLSLLNGRVSRYNPRITVSKAHASISGDKSLSKQLISRFKSLPECHTAFVLHGRERSAIASASAVRLLEHVHFHTLYIDVPSEQNDFELKDAERFLASSHRVFLKGSAGTNALYDADGTSTLLLQPDFNDMRLHLCQQVLLCKELDKQSSARRVRARARQLWLAVNEQYQYLSDFVQQALYRSARLLRAPVTSMSRANA